MSTRPRFLLAALAPAASALAIWGCSETTTTEPLGPTQSTDIVVAGTIVDTDGRAAGVGKDGPDGLVVNVLD